jgi:hypothetical protein
MDVATKLYFDAFQEITVHLFKNTDLVCDMTF